MSSSLLHLLLLLLWSLVAASQEEQNGSLPPQEVTVLGLGGMGRAVAECFASRGYRVHVWNRGEENRHLVRDTPNIVVHDALQTAVEACPLVIMVVVADRQLQAANSIIDSVPKQHWNNKTLVQYSTHEPESIKLQETKLLAMGARGVIGGAIVAVPHMVCSKAGTYLVSSSDTEVLQETLPVLEELGPHRHYTGDVGYAALAYFGLIQSLQFGLAGHELSLLLMREYKAPRDLIQSYTDLIQQNVPLYFKRFTGLATTAVLDRDYESLSRTFLPSPAYLEILEMQADFIQSMGILLEDTYLHQYLNVFRRLPDDGSVGPTAVVEYYKTMKPKDDGTDEL